MTAAQTSVTYPDIAFPGMVADNGQTHRVGKRNAEASAEIAFGLAVVRDATDKDGSVVLPHTSAAAAAPLLEGIVTSQHIYDPDLQLGDTGVKPGLIVYVARRGRVYVTPEQAVAPGDAVRVRVVATGDEKKGAFRKDADSTDCVDISAFAQWRTTGSATKPAELEFDFLHAKSAVADT